MKLHSMLFITLFFIASACGEPLLVVVLMVKDEAPVIVQTLQPFVDGGVKDFVVFDTGSTDGTQEIAAEFFKQHNLTNAHVVEEPFIDFSTSRNHALDAAQSLFPDATFMIMPDAEWYMHNVEALVQFCSVYRNDCQHSYFISTRSTSLAFVTSRLIRCRTQTRFVGSRHEALNKLTTVTLPEDIYFEWRPSQKGNEKSALRWLRDRDALLEDYAKNPSDVRTLFYLAQTYHCLGDWHNAYMFYQKRIALPGWDEENFITQVRMGDVAQQLILTDDTSICPLAIRHYLEAFALRPHRAEPLIKIAQYYLGKEQMHLAFLFAARAVNIAYPAQDRLFIEKYMYDFVRYDILGICAWYVGEYEVGEWAVKKALEINPDAPHLKLNLKFYADHKLAAA